MPNFKKLARNYEKNAILTLQELVKIDSTFDQKTVSPQTPYGKGVDRALDALLKLSKEHGFKVEKTLNRCAEVSFGEQGPLVGVYAHLDVVPATGKWDYPPFGAKIEGEGKQRKLYGRGASDDKGRSKGSFTDVGPATTKARLWPPITRSSSSKTPGSSTGTG